MKRDRECQDPAQRPALAAHDTVLRLPQLGGLDEYSSKPSTNHVYSQNAFSSIETSQATLPPAQPQHSAAYTTAFHS